VAVQIDLSARMYCDEADVTTRIDIRNLPDVNLEHLVRVATARIELETGRVFQRVPSTGTEERHFLGNGLTMLPIDDLLTFSSITIDDDSEDTDDFLCMPFGKTPTTWLEFKDPTAWWYPGYARGTWPLRADVAITGAWGYAEEVPWLIWDSCVALVVRALGRAKTAYQDGSAIPELGEMIYAKALPADVQSSLATYRKTSL